MKQSKRTIAKVATVERTPMALRYYWSWKINDGKVVVHSHNFYRTQGGALKMLRATAERLNIRIPFINVRW